MRPVRRTAPCLVRWLARAAAFARVPLARPALILKQTIRSMRVTLIASAVLLSLGALSGDVARAQDKVRRVLMLYPYNNLFPLSVITGEAARKRLTDRSREPLELYADFLDLGRFSGEAYETRTARYLVDKYRDRKPDVVMALGPQALQFVMRNRAALAFDMPIVFCCTSRARLAALNPPGDVTGIISEFDLAGTLSLAQRLQPDARHIVVVAVRPYSIGNGSRSHGASSLPMSKDMKHGIWWTFRMTR
jgi:hypothetical protein